MGYVKNLIMDTKDYDKWSDELDSNSLNEKGVAILKRRYIKGDKYLNLFDDSPVIAEGITAFLYSDSYASELQLPTLISRSVMDNLDVNKYFQQYFAIRKNFYQKKEKTKPDSIHKNLDKEFILNHIKQETRFYSKYKDYFETINDNQEKIIRQKFVKSYIKWISDKRKPLKLLNYLELISWFFLCLMVTGLIILELFYTNREWNIIQSINKLFQKSDDIQRQIISKLVFAFIASFAFAFIRIKKIVKEHRI